MSRSKRFQGWEQLQPFLPRRSRLRITVISVSSFVGGLAESGVLVIVALVADSLIKGGKHISPLGLRVTLTEAVAFALILVIVRVITSLGGAFVASRFAALVMLSTQKQLATAYLNTSHQSRSSRNIGDLATVAVNHGRIMGDLSATYAALATAMCGVAAFGGMSLVVNPVASLAIAVVGACVIALMRPLRSRSKDASMAYAATTRAIGTETTQIEIIHREIQVFGVRDRVLDNLEKEFQKGSHQQARLSFISGSIPPIFQSALLASAVLCLLVIVNVATSSSVAAIGAVVLLLLRSMSATQQMVSAFQQIVERGAYGVEITALLESLQEARQQFGQVDPESMTPLVLSDVDFSYGGERLALSHLNIQFVAGEIVGLVGPSGAGKSTLVELLLRLRQPTSGHIMCSGNAMNDVDNSVFVNRVAFVPQNPVLINGSVYENIDFFRGLPPHQIMAALRDAHLEAEIFALSDGVHTRLGPESRSLSGGQKQRLTIARALAGQPEILILDEPTSALDAVSEEAIRQTLDEMACHSLVLIVAHRYSTLSSCSRIIAIEDGVVQADASPQDVVDASDFFRRMVGSSEVVG